MAVKAKTQSKRMSSKSRPAKRRPPDREYGRQGDTKPIAAVERALHVLSAFRIAPRLTLSELSTQTGLFKSTLLRILSTLELNGYVTRLSGGQYRVGGIVYELGSSYAASFDLSEIIKPALADLSRLTGESTAFYVPAGSKRQCVFRVQSSQAVRHVIEAGQIIDLDGASTSQLLRRYAQDATRPSESTDYTSLCISSSGIGDSQTASVAAPVFDTSGFVGVLNVSGPVGRFNAQLANSCLAVLALVAQKVTRSLGGFHAGSA
jgi:DNA-binding IclR family transcriptional regulator